MRVRACMRVMDASEEEPSPSCAMFTFQNKAWMRFRVACNIAIPYNHLSLNYELPKVRCSNYSPIIKDVQTLSCVNDHVIQAQHPYDRKKWGGREVTERQDDCTLLSNEVFDRYVPVFSLRERGKCREW